MAKKREHKRDTSEEAGTGKHDDAKDRESQDLTVETRKHGADGDSRDGEAGMRHGTPGAGEPHTCDTRATHTSDYNVQGSK